jgi:Ni/Co efflux regulator RcnB
MKKYLTSVVLTLISAATFAQASSEKSINQINNGMPNRISMNVTVAKQTQGATFGEKVNAGLHSAGSAVASGASLASAPGNPVGGIIVKGAVAGIVVAPTQAGIKKNPTAAVNPGQPIGGIVVKGGISQ